MICRGGGALCEEDAGVARRYEEGAGEAEAAGAGGEEGRGAEDGVGGAEDRAEEGVVVEGAALHDILFLGYYYG